MTAPTAAGTNHQERKEISRLGSGSVLNLGSALIAQLLTLASIVVLGNLFGAKSVGIYSEAFAIRALVSLLCMGGMRNAMTRYVAAYLAADDPAGARGAMRIGLWSSTILSALATVLLVALARPLAIDAFNEPELQSGIVFGALSLVPATVTTVALAATQGFHTMKPYAIIGSVLDAALRLAFVLIGAAAATASQGTETALLGLLVSAVATGVASLVALRRLSARLGHAKPRYDVTEIGRYSLYSWMSSVANQGLLWADTVILGLFVAAREVGVYQVATRAVLLATIAVIPLNASFAPLASDLWHRRALDRLRRAYTATAEWLLRLSFPPLLVITLFAGVVLRIFGSDFQGGVIVIQVFAAGALLDSWASSAGVSLNMTGYNRLNMLDTVGVLVLNVALNIVLIPVLGIAGSAWAWTLALVAYGMVRIVQVDRLVLGSWPLSGRSRATLLAAIPAVVIAFAARLTLGDTIAGLLVGGALATLAYLLVLVRFGINDEDRVLLHLPARKGTDVTLPTGRAAATVRRREELRRRMSASAARLHRSRSTRYWRPDVPVPVSSLISPLRVDILVRADFFDFFERRFAGRSFEMLEVVEAARELPYYEWFQTVATAHVIDGVSDDHAVDRAFALRVQRSVWLYEKFQTRGFDARRPVLLSWSDDVRTAEGKQLGPRHQPIDGCHRIALLWRAGVEALHPDQAWVCAAPDQAIDNTIMLLDRLPVGPEDYAWFLALGLGFDEDRPDLPALVARVRDRDGDDAARRLRNLIAIDTRSRPDLAFPAEPGTVSPR